MRIKMARIFIFSNSYAAKTILLELDYLLNIEIDEIFLLKENHDEKEHYTCNNAKIKIHKSVDTCISFCDTIILIKDSNMPEKSIDYLLSESKRLNKNCFVVQNPWEKEFIFSTNEKSYENFDFKKYPVILNISLGSNTQQFFIELMMNRLFVENKINFRQVYSAETSDFLHQINNFGLLNNNIFEQLNMIDNQYNIIIISLNIGNLYNMKKYVDIVKFISPDFITIQSDLNLNEYDYVNNMVKYGYFSKLDLLIKSHYYLLQNKFNIYCDKKIDNDFFIQDIESDNFDKKLYNAILAKIALPEYVVKL